MLPILQYLLKLSISLSVVYLFYHFVLRRLTFYNWNRWYLASYSLLAFFIPFVDLSLVFGENELDNTAIFQWVPALNGYSNSVVMESRSADGFTSTTAIKLVLFAGMFVMLLRLVIQLFSFRQMLKRASVIPADGMKIYQVDKPIIPFSFGNSIFINRSMHNDQDLQEIIFHEFVHVKQKHSIDIILSELFCLLNWYNPFAWLIRKAIRQNLEFIADNQVLQHGIDRRQYQYLLLKVIGNNQFSIASKFNFSSLKKRIAMMNKMKSAGVHAIKFLFILPLVAVLLLAFRNNYTQQLKKDVQQSNLSKLDPSLLRTLVFTDSVPEVKKLNSKGYLINVKGVDGECVVVVKDKTGKEVERIVLNDWKEKSEQFEEKFGEIPPPPPPLIPTHHLTEVMAATEATTPHPPTRIMDCLEPTMVSCAHDDTPVPCLTHGCCPAAISKLGKKFEITDKLATITQKDGKVEKYDLTKPADKAAFEAKYGITQTVPGGVNYRSVIGRPGVVGQTILAPMAPGEGQGVMILDDYGYTITGKEDILVRITRNTTRQELDQFKVKMKEKGIDLSFDEIEYNEKGKLVSISGRMKSKDGQSNFSANDFELLLLAMMQKDNQTYFKVSTKDKEVI